MGDSTSGFSEIEREAMKQRAAELKAMKGVTGAAKRAKEFEACIAAIDALPGVDGAAAQTLHCVVTELADHLAPKTYYGFPAYAKDDKVVVYYQPSTKFKTRYGHIAFTDLSTLDDGDLFPISFAVTAVTPAVEQAIRDLVTRATG